MRLPLLLVALAIAAASTRAELVRQPVEYKDGDTVLEGQLVYNDAARGVRPGLVMFHAWSGISSYEMMRAEQFAQMGLVVLVADVYGKGVRPADMEARTVETTKYRSNRALMRSRARAALDVLRVRENVNTERIAAIGFCFGGTVALELTRDGAPLAGVISVHGGLDTPHPDASRVRCPVLVLHGGNDPFVPDSQVQTFRDEMRSAKVDWQIVEYGGAVHAFTDPGAGADVTRGAAYDERATRRAIAEIRRFLRDAMEPARAE